MIVNILGVGSKGGCSSEAMLLISLWGIEARLPYCGAYAHVWLETLPAYEGPQRMQRFLCVDISNGRGWHLENSGSAYSQYCEDRWVAAIEAYASDR